MKVLKYKMMFAPEIYGLAYLGLKVCQIPILIDIYKGCRTTFSSDMFILLLLLFCLLIPSRELS